MVAIGLLLSAQLAPSAALACEGGAALSKKVFDETGKEVSECVFTKINEKCKIEFKVTGAGEGWKVEEDKWEGGTPPAGRYAKTVGCTPKVTVLKTGQKCEDVMERTNNEKSKNEWCILFETESGALGKVGGCTKLEIP